LGGPEPCSAYAHRAKLVRGLRSLAFVGALVVSPALAHASTVSARVDWQPSGSPGVTGYRIYRRPTGGSYDSITDAGSPAPGADGTLAGVVSGLDASTAYAFSVTAYRSDGTESAHSNEIVLQLAGTTGPNPCAGAAAPASIDVQRMLVRARGSALNARASFPVGASFDASSTGITLETLNSDGTVVYQATVPASAIRSGRSGTSFRFVSPRRGATVPGTDGLKRLSIRVVGDTAILTAVATTAGLRAAVTAAGLDLVVRAGTLCARSLGVQCDPLSGRTTCASGAP